ncbi:MAG: hypothetical protein WAQ08_10960 [Aquabacterium sp.]|uniref:hypothetical protein n=1 Tax=Aquabacterium sp. TaxID=1872578 RepID=UPI003BAE4A93
MIYSAKARIIDTSSKTVVAESFCSRVPDANGKEPTYDELVGNSAAGLKKELASHASNCSEEIKTKMLTIASTS